MGRDARNPDLAARRPDLAVDQLQKGGLASAAGTDEEGELTRLEAQIDSIEGAPRSVEPAYRAELDDWAHFPVGRNGARREFLERPPLSVVSSGEHVATFCPRLGPRPAPDGT